MPVSVLHLELEEFHEVVRCFRCPKERRAHDAGWHYMDLSSLRGGARRSRVYVCSRDYMEFASAERIRWVSVGEPGGRAAEPATREAPALALVDGADYRPPRADELALPLAL